MTSPNHLGQVWAADLFTVQALTFKTLYVVLFVAHDRRELVHWSVAASPTAARVWRELIESAPWGRQPRYLARDRDAVYGGDVDRRAGALDIRALLTPIRGPRANAIAERVVGTLRRQCLDHVAVLRTRFPFLLAGTRLVLADPSGSGTEGGAAVGRDRWRCAAPPKPEGVRPRGRRGS